jgi:tetratricopeptide (TPR) repeat protein
MRYFWALVLLLLTSLAAAQLSPVPAQTVVVIPFENASKAPGLEWLGESFPEVLGARMASGSLFVIRREDRVYAFDRVGIPASVRPSRPTIYRVADELDAEIAITGSYNYDGQTFSARAQVIDVKRLKLLPEVTESGSLLNLIAVENAVAWDLLQQLRPAQGGSKQAFVAAESGVRLDAFENYIRGITAAARPEQIRRFREALRLNPQYADAMFQLGKAYFDARDYANAAAWLGRVPRADKRAGEAAFYEGLAHFYLAEFDKAEAAFSNLAERMPLTEVFNNLGVVAGRRGKRTAVDYFQKAAQADPNDADYHFNLAVALARGGEPQEAVRHLREALARRAQDGEARALLDALQRNQAPAKPPLERIKRNYDEQSFRQLQLEIQNASEARLAQRSPAEHAAFHVEHARQVLNEGFRADAEKEFREAVLLDPANAAAHAGLAAALVAQDAAAARSEAEAALRLAALADAHLVLARLALRDNNRQVAVAEVKQALELEPGNSAAQQLHRELAVAQP